jgi:hypothetical protein
MTWLCTTLALLCARAAVPGNVTDLAVVATTATTVTLSWTEVASGTTTPASYDIRYGPAAGFAWWLVHLTPPDTLTGTTPAGGAKITRVVTGLQPSTAYSFQVVAFTGILGAATFGQLSNVAPGMTAALPPPPSVATSVTINQAVVELVGQRTPLVATVRDQNGAVMVAPVTWRSRTPAIATVDTAGVVLGVAPGIDTVTAAAGQAIGQTLITIQAPPPPPAAVARVLLNTSGTVMLTAVGGTYQAIATVVDSTGAVLARPVSWTASNASASVDSTGLVTARAFGTDTITASAGGKANFFYVLVGSPPPPPPAAVAVAQAVAFGGFGIPLLSGIYHGTFTDSTGVVAHWTLTVVIP